jgi:hypothetical protein
MKRNCRIVKGIQSPEWTELALQLGEMWLASAKVIAHRTTRMAAAGPMPGERDRDEFTLMGREKFDATNESALAVAAHFSTMHLQFGTPAFGSLMSGTALLAAFSELSDSAARLFGSSLAPIHARATANARRLGKD